MRGARDASGGGRALQSLEVRVVLGDASVRGEAKRVGGKRFAKACSSIEGISKGRACEGAWGAAGGSVAQRRSEGRRAQRSRLDGIERFRPEEDAAGRSAMAAGGGVARMAGGKIGDESGSQREPKVEEA